MKRRDFITLLGGAAATWPMAARAQQSIPVVGVLRPNSVEDSARSMGPFRDGLREMGFVEGQNVALEYRWAHGQYAQLPALSAELAQRKVAVIATNGSLPATLAAKAATTTIPIVFSIGSDPVAAGLVASLNRPGGNMTGVYYLNTDLAAKRLGLLHELLPRAAVVAVLTNPGNVNAGPARKEAQAAADLLGLKLDFLQAGNSREIDAAFATFAERRADAMLVINDAFLTTRRTQIITLATRRGIPAIYTSREYTEIGGLMSYGTNLADANRQVGVYIGRILKGEKPADLPVVQPTKFEFIINLQTAKAFGLEIPATLLARADEVIE